MFPLPRRLLDAVLGLPGCLHEARFGARRERRWAYVQPTETYDADDPAHLAETAPTS